MHRAEEREAKFDGVEGDLPDFSGLIDRARVVEPPPAHLVAVYVDTEDLVLLRRGMTLRHRHDARGGESGWTLKLPNGTGKAAFERVEISWSGPPDRVPEEAERLLRPLTGSAALVPVAELTTDRRRLELRDEDGGRLAEVDDDRVTVSVPQVTHFRQVEVELHEADDSLLDELAGRLRAAGAERSPDEPKIRRALEPRLREAESRPPPPPAPTSTVGELVAAAITDGLERLLAHDTGVRLDQGAEFVHQARVATRRLRSDLKTLGEVLDAEWVRTTRRELKWVADHLGAVRDADVLLARLQRIAAESAPDDAGAMAALREHLSIQRRAAHRRLVDAMDERRYLALVEHLRAAVDEPPFADPRSGSVPSWIEPSAPAVQALRPLVRRPWRRVARAVQRLGDPPSDEELHKLRIRAKQLRYAAELAAPVVGRRAAALAAAAEDLQTVLGDQHDAVAAELWLRETAAAGTTAQVFAAGQAVAHERRRQAAGREAWPAAWRALRRKKLRGWTRR